MNVKIAHTATLTRSQTFNQTKHFVHRTGWTVLNIVIMEKLLNVT
jgi:hypothetical protein